MPQITYPPTAPQIIYPPPVPQITYPAQNSTNPQVKTKANPPLPPLSQIQEPQQQNKAFPTHGTILAITRGSNTDFDTIQQRWDYYQEVNHVAIEGPITQTKWSHIPITFSAQDVILALFPHTDAMVLTVDIDRWDVSRILINNGSKAEILFLSAFKKMGYDKKQLKEPMKPLLWLRRSNNRVYRDNNIAHLFRHPKKPLHINLRCGRYAISLQCHIWARPIEHLWSRPTFRVTLPQSPSHFRRNNCTWLWHPTLKQGWSILTRIITGCHYRSNDT
jgi:hypothetical protein